MLVKYVTGELELQKKKSKKLDLQIGLGVLNSEKEPFHLLHIKKLSLKP